LGESSRGFSIELKDLLAGYGERVSADIPVGTPSRGGALGPGAEAGIESVIFTGEEEFRRVSRVRPTLRLPLSTRWDPQLGALASALSSTPNRDKVFGDGVTNSNH
jgi:hypothetical protein